MSAVGSSTSKEVLWSLFDVLKGSCLCALFVLGGGWQLYAETHRQLVTLRQWDPRFFFMVSITLLHALFSLVLSPFFMLCDHLGWFSAYKLHRSERMRPTRGLMVEALVEAVLGTLVITPFAAWALYPTFVKFGGEVMPVVRPPFVQSWVDFCLSELTNQFLFYWFHRIFHHRSLYKAIHKKHHRFVGTVAPASEFAHPLEAIFANTLPVILYSVVRGVHLCVFLVWLFWRVEETYEAHSGFCFSDSFLGRLGLLNGRKAVLHDWHHTENRGNYGTGMIFDGLFGTAEPFMKAGGWKAYKERALNQRGSASGGDHHDTGRDKENGKSK
uniref:Fatty acid hydroxylase domain-containing protein n=1 Tax=Chromera velia CCMP2878 TaxID=1169474 RepID=A0A0G4HDL2_9ALVE|eukprot:Cvel_26322.t1-p1 / transcript=Cvel_26322.t1 / gene=Cvel_26322 / organism=Chromera_velia_CCMP2878 / gene_product=Methylsterol monooxygenase 2-2, putative / transcript_product=Methylsterol monooxygenase 2-2, putative / location=Cvel_scaffold3111:17814-18794(+) / protein_length=327 / sequence_SO=supercontig / SO=protein_coding / is_pseudo=false